MWFLLHLGIRAMADEPIDDAAPTRLEVEALCSGLRTSGDMAVVLASRIDTLTEIADGFDHMAEDDMLGIEWRIRQVFDPSTVPEAADAIRIVEEATRTYKWQAEQNRETIRALRPTLIAYQAVPSRRLHGEPLRTARDACITHTLASIQSTTDAYTLAFTQYDRIGYALERLVATYGPPKIIVIVPAVPLLPIAPAAASTDPAAAPLADPIPDPDRDVRIGPLP